MANKRHQVKYIERHVTHVRYTASGTDRSLCCKYFFKPRPVDIQTTACILMVYVSEW